MYLKFKQKKSTDDTAAVKIANKCILGALGAICVAIPVLGIMALGAIALKALQMHLKQSSVSNQITPKITTGTSDSFTPIDDTNVKSILKVLGSDNKHFEVKELYKEYGNQIFNSEHLLTQINNIQDVDDKNVSMNNFLKFQLSMVGHEFSWGGEIYVNRNSKVVNSYKNKLMQIITKIGLTSESKNITLEGMFQDRTHLKMAQSLEKYKDGGNTNIPESFIKAMENAALIESSPKNVNYEEILKDIKEGIPVTIPTGWIGHAVEITISKDMLAYSNRGQSSEEWANLGTGSGIQIYKIGDPEKLDAAFLKEIIKCANKKYLDSSNFLESKEGGLRKGLKLEEFTKIDQEGQKVGNCAWASTKCGLLAMLYLESLNKNPLNDLRSEFNNVLNSDIPLQDKRTQISEILGKTEIIYKEKGIKEDSFIQRSKLAPNESKYLDNNVFIEGATNYFTNAINKPLIAISKSEIMPIYKECMATHRKEEYSFFINFLTEHNAGKELLTKKEELKFLSEMFNKYLETNKKGEQIKLIKNPEKSIEINDKESIILARGDTDKSLNMAKEIFELTKSFLAQNNYSVSDATISLDKLKNEEKATDFIGDMLYFKQAGAFLITENNGITSLNYRITNTKFASLPMNEVIIDGKQASTLEDVMKFLKQKLSNPNIQPVPIFNQHSLNRAITGIKGLD